MRARYLIIPKGRDGCDLPITPEPVPLLEVGNFLARWFLAFIQKGQPYFSNCRMERIPLDELEFELVPVEEDSGGSKELNAREVREWSGE